VWLSIGEAILRTRRPSTVPFLLTDNAARFLTWSRLGAGSGGRAPVAAGLLLAFYAAALTVLALLHFRRTDAIAA
jgi:hypothetical protein